jgi:hypothetical protein
MPSIEARVEQRRRAAAVARHYRDAEEDTTRAPRSVSEARAHWITRYLNARFLQLPDHVEVLVSRTPQRLVDADHARRPEAAVRLPRPPREPPRPVRTVEHWFQACKATSRWQFDLILACGSARRRSTPAATPLSSPQLTSA